MRSAIPSNTLAVLYGLAVDCRDRQVLGPDVEIDIFEADETNTRIRPERIARTIAAAGGLGLVALVGVQSNQFPRAMDLARRLRAAGIQVAIGGFHVSGCLAMLPELPADLQEALDLGISLFAGEAEGRLDEVLRDAAAGHAEADLQLHGRPAGPGGRAAADPAGRADRAHRRPAVQLRCRPRLPVPVLVLHHHQRAGPQVALSLRRTTSRR